MVHFVQFISHNSFLSSGLLWVKTLTWAHLTSMGSGSCTWQSLRSELVFVCGTFLISPFLGQDTLKGHFCRWRWKILRKIKWTVAANVIVPLITATALLPVILYQNRLWWHKWVEQTHNEQLLFVDDTNVTDPLSRIYFRKCQWSLHAVI